VIVIPPSAETRPRCTSVTSLPSGLAGVQCTLLQDHPLPHMFAMEWGDPDLPEPPPLGPCPECGLPLPGPHRGTCSVSVMRGGPGFVSQPTLKLLRSYMEVALDRAREALDAVEAGAPLWQSTEPLRAAISQLEEGLRDA
jgi:hypothetical protein